MVVDSSLRIDVTNESGSHYNYIKPLISPDSKRVYLSNGFTISIYSIASGQLLQTLKGHEKRIIGICINLHSRNSILSCDVGGNVIIWNELDFSMEKLVILSDKEKEKSMQVSYFDMYDKELLIYSLEYEERTLFLKKIHQTKKKPIKVFENIKYGANCVSFSKNRMISSLQCDRKILLKKPPFMGGQWVRHTTANDVTCIVCHPRDEVIAVGDIIGCITILFNVFSDNWFKSNLHWHTLPVADLAFSSEGSELYSGGGECVLVVWQISEQRKYFIPRLGAPLKSIATDSSKSSIVVVHVDRDVSVLNAIERCFIGKISRLMYHESENPLTIGLIPWPGSDLVILNGRTGHVQFYNPFTDAVVFHLDITMCNYLSSERQKVLPNPEVVKAATSSDGQWMATVESCSLSPTFCETVLNFWSFSKENQRWEQNSNIQTPHNQKINSICFLPSNASEVSLCITCGQDKLFIIWKLFKYLDANGMERCHWNRIASKDFRDLEATAGSFSPDGSLLAVGFDSIITLWRVEDLSFAGLLTQPFLTERIEEIFFCGGEFNGSLLISQSETQICCWDLLSCCLLWELSLAASHIVINPDSGYIAVFAKTNSVYILSPRCCKIVSCKFDISDSTVLGAAFVSAIQKESSSSPVQRPWKSDHHLFFVTQDQLICGINLDGDSTVDRTNEKYLAHENSQDANTPFAAALPVTRKIVDSPEQNYAQHSYKMPKFIELLDETSIHNMTSFSSLLNSCDSLIPAPSHRENKGRIQFNSKMLMKELRKERGKEAIVEEPSVTAESVRPDIIPKLMERIEKIDFNNLVRQMSLPNCIN